MYDIGMIGLAVMGENLSLNIASNGFSVMGYDISSDRMVAFRDGRAIGQPIGFASSLEDLIANLSSPRKIMIMIRAGRPVDDVVSELLPLLETGDIIIDGGNSHYNDTKRRAELTRIHGIHYIGSGVSGGEEGALHGPSLMPGGHKEAWEHVQPIFEAIAAKTPAGDVCTTWIGPEGSGHFVKMVHNGIEYGDIQLITEIYHIMRDILQMTPDEMANVFAQWNQTELNSYLVEITVDILRYKDENNQPLIDSILDTAGQKGTGKWTVIQSLTEGVPLPLIAEAVIARLLSSMKEERVLASTQYPRQPIDFKGNKDVLLAQLKDALYTAKLMSYAQGFSLLSYTSNTYNWDLNLGDIAMIWREGCIIKSIFLDDIKDAYANNTELPNLLLDTFFQTAVNQRLDSYRQVISTAVLYGIPTPSLSAGLHYFDGYTTNRLPANLLQAMRDYFGAHTYERVDRERGESFHTNWSGATGSSSSTTYNV